MDTRFHDKLNVLKHIFLKNGYPLSFIGKCFKIVMNNLVVKRPQTTTVEQKTLIMSLSYLGDISSQTRTELTLQAPIPQNGQTHSNNSSTKCRRIV